MRPACSTCMRSFVFSSSWYGWLLSSVPCCVFRSASSMTPPAVLTTTRSKSDSRVMRPPFAAAAVEGGVAVDVDDGAAGVLADGAAGVGAVVVAAGALGPPGDGVEL